MNQLFETSLAYRGALANMLEKVDEDKMDQVAKGFNNTIRWQLAHLVATQANLTYKMVGQESPLLSAEFLASAKKGTNHENFSLNEDYGTKHLLEFLVETTKQLQRDFKELKKHEFKPYETSTGLMLKDVETSLAFSNIHDGWHIGNIAGAIKALS